MRTSAVERTVTYAVLVLAAVLALYPVVLVLVKAVQPDAVGAAHGVDLGNFSAAWKQGEFGHYLRTSVIVTRQRDYSVPGAIVTHSVEEALEACSNDDECFVIGGADLFRDTLPRADRLYLTTVEAEPSGDTFMPELDLAEWKETSAQSFPPAEKHAHGYRFAMYDRARSAGKLHPA